MKDYLRRISLIFLLGDIGSFFNVSLADTTYPTTLRIKPNPDTSQAALAFYVNGVNGAFYTLKANHNLNTLSLFYGNSTAITIHGLNTTAVATSVPVSAVQLELDESEVFLDSERVSRGLRKSKNVHQANQNIAPMGNSNNLNINSHRGGGRFLLSKQENGNDVTQYPRLSELIKMDKSLTVTGMVTTTSSGNVMINNVKQWKMIKHDDFQDKTVLWSIKKSATENIPATTDSCVSKLGSSPDFFLGLFQGSTETFQNFLLPKGHTRLKIQARLHYIDKWEGESIYLKVGNHIVWSQNYVWCSQLLVTLCAPKNEFDDVTTSALAGTSDGMMINACGNEQFPDRMSVKLSTVINHTDTNLRLVFGSTLKDGQAGNQYASWGVDDLEIYIL